MNLNENVKKVVQELSDAINSVVERSPEVAATIEALYKLGYQPNINLHLEIGLEDLNEKPEESDNNDFDLELTEEDLKTLHRMRIKL